MSGCVIDVPTKAEPVSGEAGQVDSSDPPEWKVEETPYKRVVWHYGHPIKFRSKESFQMLKVLIENKGERVDHAVLSAIAWPDAVTGIDKETLDARIGKLFDSFVCMATENPAENGVNENDATLQVSSIYVFTTKCWQPEGHRFEPVTLHFHVTSAITRGCVSSLRRLLELRQPQGPLFLAQSCHEFAHQDDMPTENGK